MTKEEMLSAIYDEMADKTLSDGCIIERFLDRYLIWSNILEILPDNELIHYWDVRWQEYWNNMQYEIIWHPVRIGDVIEYVRLKNIWNINPITDEWDYPRLPIDEQSDDAISFVYNLIKK